MLHDISIKDGFYDEIFSDLHIFTFLVLRNLSHQVLRNDEIQYPASHKWVSYKKKMLNGFLIKHKYIASSNLLTFIDLNHQYLHDRVANRQATACATIRDVILLVGRLYPFTPVLTRGHHSGDWRPTVTLLKVLLKNCHHRNPQIFGQMFS